MNVIARAGQPAFSEQTSFDRRDLVACGEGTLEGGGLPKLPRRRMLMFDRVTDSQPVGGEFGRGFITAELDINPDLWFFDDHFKDDPVMPGCLGLDALWQLAGFFVVLCGARGKGRALEVGHVKFAGEVLPTAKLLTYRVEVKGLLNGRSTRPWIVTTDGYVACDGVTIYTAKDIKVGVFPKPQG